MKIRRNIASLIMQRTQPRTAVAGGHLVNTGLRAVRTGWYRPLALVFLSRRAAAITAQHQHAYHHYHHQQVASTRIAYNTPVSTTVVIRPNAIRFPISLEKNPPHLSLSMAALRDTSVSYLTPDKRRLRGDSWFAETENSKAMGIQWHRDKSNSGFYQTLFNKYWQVNRRVSGAAAIPTTAATLADRPLPKDTYPAIQTLITKNTHINKSIIKRFMPRTFASPPPLKTLSITHNSMTGSAMAEIPDRTQTLPVPPSSVQLSLAQTSATATPPATLYYQRPEAAGANGQAGKQQTPEQQKTRAKPMGNIPHYYPQGSKPPLFPAAAAPSNLAIDMDRLVDTVMQKIDKQIRIERQRRGLL